MRATFFFLFLLFATLVSGLADARADSFIRDAEIEEYLRDVSTPIFKAAGLASDNVEIHIIQSDVINAFVAGGQNVFIHTGLIQASHTPEMLIGVIAHEVGHIMGGHLVQKRDQYETAVTSTALGYILGIASVAAGAPSEAAGAIISGTQHVAERGFLKHSRQFEQQADQAALGLLTQTQTSPRGLLDMMKVLQSESGWLQANLDPYRLTHPVTEERINHISQYLLSHPEADKPTEVSLEERHRRVLAKLEGFLDKPQKVIDERGKKTASVANRYALAIAWFRYPDLDMALSLMDELMKKEPQNPYFHELKGQMYYEHGRMKDAIPAYRAALELKPQEPLLMTGLALAYIQKGDEASLKRASELLKQALGLEKDNAFAWRQLGIAEGQLGNLGESYLALAESGALRGDMEEARRFLIQAEEHLGKSVAGQIRVNDLKRYIEQEKKKE